MDGVWKGEKARKKFIFYSSDTISMLCIVVQILKIGIFGFVMLAKLFWGGDKLTKMLRDQKRIVRDFFGIKNIDFLKQLTWQILDM